MKEKLIKTRENYNIELIRILACLLVIGAHYCMNHRVEADGVSINMHTVLIDSFTHSCPQAFFMITGFFMFDKEKEIKQIIKYVFNKILLPTYLLIFLGNILNDFVMGKATIIQCLFELRIDWSNLIHTILNWANSGTNSFHLWYMFSLAQVYLLYPILKLFCKDDEKSNVIRRYVLVLSILSLSVKPTIDAVLGKSFIFIPYVFMAWPVMFVILGYETKLLYYRYIEDKQGKGIFWLIGFILFVGGCLFTYALSRYVDIGNNGEYSQIFLELYMVGQFIATIGLVLFGLSIHIPRGKIAKGIQYIGSKTFVAYLVHVLVQRRMITLGFEDMIAGFVRNDYLQALICVSGYFAVSILLAIIWDKTKRLYVILTSNKQEQKVAIEANS